MLDLKDQRIAVVGAGNMGRALVGGLLHGADVPPDHLWLTRRTPEALHALAADFPGTHCLDDNGAAVAEATVLVLGVKPQGMRAVAEGLRDALRPDTLVVSILAGVTTEALEGAFGQPLPIIRAMPNTPALVDEGATALAPGRHATTAHLALARQMFEAVGRVEEVTEAHLDAVTGLSGNGPAYVFMFIEALTDAGVKQGLPRPVAARLAAQTVYGAARLVLETGKHPAILKDEVTTPGGTAIASIAELEAHGLRTMLINAVATGTARSRELSRLFNDPA